MNITPRTLALVAAGVIALVAVGGWFAVVSPQRLKVASLDAKIVDEHGKLSVARLAASSPKAAKPKPKPAGTAALAKAMPTSVQMPNILRQVQRLAAASTVTVGVVHALGGDAGGGLRRRAHCTQRHRALWLGSALPPQAPDAGRHEGATVIHADGRLFDVQTVEPHALGRRAP